MVCRSHDADDDVPNELIDTPRPHGQPDETDRLHTYIEDMLSGREPEDPNPYHGTYFEDDGEQ